MSNPRSAATADRRTLELRQRIRVRLPEKRAEDDGADDHGAGRREKALDRRGLVAVRPEGE